MEWLGRLYKSIDLLDKAIVKCRQCPRLVEWREEVAVTKRKSYENEKYWGKPVTGFGSTKPKMLIVGLAPGAHGANRTGRIFTIGKYLPANPSTAESTSLPSAINS
jgi:uracil-DNA glycosylase